MSEPSPKEEDAKMAQLRKRSYTVGWLTALSIELAAAVAMLDSRHGNPLNFHHDPQSRNHYVFGSINGHNIVISSLPDGVYGTSSATRVAEDFHRDFPDLQYRLTVGIAGGAPSMKNDVRLGDVVVSRPTGTSPGVIQYDLGKALKDGLFVPTGTLPKPPENLLRALPLVRQWPEKMLSAAVFQVLASLFQQDPRFRPPNDHDNLFEPDYHHQGIESSPCNGSCDPSFHVERRPRDPWIRTRNELGIPLEYLTWGHNDNDLHINTPPPEIHFGIIASGNTMMRDGVARTKLQSQTGALCFEFVSGIMDAWPCLVIRGICDYSDTHNNKAWQPYAAGTAAAFAKFLLMTISHPRATRQTPNLIGRAPLNPPGYASLQGKISRQDHHVSSPNLSQMESANDYRGSEPLINEVTTSTGGTIRRYGPRNSAEGAEFNGEQKFFGKNISFISGKGNVFNGSQIFEASGDIQF